MVARLENGTAQLADGIYPGMPRREYEAIEAARFSFIKHFRRTPAHAREELLHPKEPTEALDFGNALDCALLEPERFAEEYVVAPKCDRRYKEGKATWNEFEAANPGKEILEADDMRTIEAMQESALDNELVAALLSAPGKNKVAVIWHDGITGLRCKGQIDRVVNYAGQIILLDIKSCRDASRGLFGAACAEYSYHEQASFYLHGLDMVDPSPTERKFWFITIEKSRPYLCAVRELDSDSLEAGRGEWRDHLLAYKKCLETNNWPGYPAEAERIRLPKWALAGVVNDAAAQRAFTSWQEG